MPDFDIPCLLSKQRGTPESPTFAIFDATASSVLQWSAIRRRSETEAGTQRKLSKSKIGAIRRFFSGDDRNTIPSAVIVTLTIDPAQIEDACQGDGAESPFKRLRFSVVEGTEDAAKPGMVIDGQHRLIGISQYSPDCRVNVVALLNVNDMEKAF